MSYYRTCMFCYIDLDRRLHNYQRSRSFLTVYGIGGLWSRGGCRGEPTTRWRITGTPTSRESLSTPASIPTTTVSINISKLILTIRKNHLSPPNRNPTAATAAAATRRWAAAWSSILRPPWSVLVLVLIPTSSNPNVSTLLHVANIRMLKIYMMMHMNACMHDLVYLYTCVCIYMVINFNRRCCDDKIWRPN